MYEVLYLEDEPDMVDDCPKLLLPHSLNLSATTSIEEAFRLFEEKDFDAVLLDIGMPPAADIDPYEVAYGRETGIAIAKRFKAQKPFIPIIALTVINDPDIISKMRKAGIGCIINKPVEPARIAEGILKEIKRY